MSYISVHDPRVQFRVKVLSRNPRCVGLLDHHAGGCGALHSCPRGRESVIAFIGDLTLGCDARATDACGSLQTRTLGIHKLVPSLSHSSSSCRRARAASKNFTDRVLPQPAMICLERRPARRLARRKNHASKIWHDTAATHARAPLTQIHRPPIPHTSIVTAGT